MCKHYLVNNSNSTLGDITANYVGENDRYKKAKAWFIYYSKIIKCQIKKT